MDTGTNANVSSLASSRRLMVLGPRCRGPSLNGFPCADLRSSKLSRSLSKSALLVGDGPKVRTLETFALTQAAVRIHKRDND